MKKSTRKARPLPRIGDALFFWQVFARTPLTALALSLCLASIVWCAVMINMRRQGPDRFLAMLIGVICASQSMRLLRDAGLMLPGSRMFDAFTDVVITGLYLIAVVILRTSALDRQTTRVRLRLVEANEPAGGRRVEQSLDPHMCAVLLESNPLPTVAVDSAGAVVYWNFAAEQLFGWRLEDVIGKPSPVTEHGKIRTKSGADIDVEIWVAPLRVVPGTPSGTLLTFVPLPADNSQQLSPSKPSYGVRRLITARS